MADLDGKALAMDALSGMVRDGGDLGYMEDVVPALTAFLSQLAAPDFVCLMVGGRGQPLAYPGVDGLAEAWREWGEAFESVRAELEGVRESEEHIVIMIRQVATTRHHGVELSQPSAMVLAFEHDRVARLEFHLDRDAALRSAGIDPAARG